MVVDSSTTRTVVWMQWEQASNDLIKLNVDGN
uniref:Uncharacterized protein n=1 Tax=Nelumbo nucifera TaxID=4432 RepID=A0A822XJ78_NELNU|nr:TPA_asm: hypothetical protein HUJ06_020288 [Nelumbo nucifera]